MRKFGVILFNLTLILALYLVTAVPVRAGPISSISITPVDPSAGVTTDYSISFSPTTTEISSVLINFSAFGTTGTDMVLSGVSTNIGDYSFGGFLVNPTGVTVDDGVAKTIEFTGGRQKKNTANTIANAVPGTGLVITNDQNGDTQLVTISSTTDSGTFSLAIIPPPDISNTPNSWSFGAVDINSTYPTGIDYIPDTYGFRLTNASLFTVNITISAGSMSDIEGGTPWALADNPAGDTYALRAGTSDTGTYDVTVTSGGISLKDGLLAETSIDWGLQLLTPTFFSDGYEKSGTVTLTATQA